MLEYVIRRVALSIAEGTGISPKLAVVVIVAAVPLLAWALRALYYSPAMGGKGRPEPAPELDLVTMLKQSSQAQAIRHEDLKPDHPMFAGGPRIAIRHYFPDDDDPILYGQTHLSYPIRGKAKGDA